MCIEQVLYKQSVLPFLISAAGQITCVLLAYVIPLIYIASLAVCSVPRHDRPEVWKLYCLVKFVSMIEALKFVTIEAESWSHTPSLRLRHLCTHYSITTFYHMHYYN